MMQLVYIGLLIVELTLRREQHPLLGLVLVKHGRKRIDVQHVGEQAQARLSQVWQPLGDADTAAPRLRPVEISSNRLWSGMAASNALNDYLNKSEQIPVVKRAEEEVLFAAMRQRMFEAK